jgi:hypothetical protein
MMIISRPGAHFLLYESSLACYPRTLERTHQNPPATLKARAIPTRMVGSSSLEHASSLLSLLLLES